MTLSPSPRYRPRFRKLPRSVTAVPSEAQHGELVEAHSHPWIQLLYGSEGVIRVRTALGVWIIPPRRALLIAPGIVHELTMLSRVNMRTLYIAPEAAGDLVDGCRVLEVSPLLRELILALSAEPVDYPPGGRGEALARLILSELAAMETVPIAWQSVNVPPVSAAMRHMILRALPDPYFAPPPAVMLANQPDSMRVSR